MSKMNKAQLDAFLAEARIAKLVTLYADGSPSVVPVWFEWDGERARLFTSRNSEKVGRIKADPRVCVSVEEPVGVPEAWATIEGTAGIVESGGYALAERLAPRYYGAEKAVTTLQEWAASADQWVVIEITPRRIRSMAP